MSTTEGFVSSRYFSPLTTPSAQSSGITRSMREEADMSAETTKRSKSMTNKYHYSCRTPDVDCDKFIGRNMRQETYSDNNSSINESDPEEVLRPSDFQYFAANSTFHGMAHIFTPGKLGLRNLLWAAAFITSLGFFLQQAYDRYVYYRSHPHVTKLDEMEAEIIMFPAVTICNINSFRLNALTTEDYYHTGEHILDLLNSDYSQRDMEFQDNKTWSKIWKKIKPIVTQRNDFDPKSDEFDMFEFYNRTGHNLFHDGIVKECKFRNITCNSFAYWSPVFTRFGKCYTFNAGKLGLELSTPKGGVYNGLEILLDTQQDEYMPVLGETDEISIEAGFKVQIHTPEEPPFIHELGFGISPGYQTLVATQEQQITFLPYPYGNCIQGDKFDSAFYQNYSISGCRITCETRIVVEKCHCRMVHMPGKARYCDPAIYKNCGDVELDKLVQTSDKLCVCGTPCKIKRYNLEMSSLKLPSTQALSYLAYKYGKTEEYVRNNFLKLNVFFEALNYETIEQKKAYEIPGLFGDIGGQMGLFIGASILTVLELFDYVYEVIKEKTWGKRLRKMKENLSSAEAYQHEMSAIEDGERKFQPRFGLDNRLPQADYGTYNQRANTSDFQTLTPLTESPLSIPIGKIRARAPPQYLRNSLINQHDVTRQYNSTDDDMSMSNFNLSRMSDNSWPLPDSTHTATIPKYTSPGSMWQYSTFCAPSTTNRCHHYSSATYDPTQHQTSNSYQIDRSLPGSKYQQFFETDIH